MIKEISEEKCNGCEICFDICPQDVFRMDEKMEKAVIRYPEDCITACYECELRCPTGAINVDPFKRLGPVTLKYTKGSEDHA